MKRSTPLKRTTSLRRRVSVRRRNAKRLKRLRAVQFGVQAQLCRESRCVACSALGVRQKGASEPHHWPTRAAGGLDADTVPLCAACHRRAHDIGHETFWGAVGIEFADVVARMRALVVDDSPVSPLLGMVAWR